MLFSNTVRVRIRFGVWLVNGHAHVFKILSVVTVPYPFFARGKEVIQTLLQVNSSLLTCTHCTQCLTFFLAAKRNKHAYYTSSPNITAFCYCGGCMGLQK